MITILVGVSGSGKSTHARTLFGEVCEADTYPGLYHNGVLQPSLLSTAHQSCQQQVEECMKQGIPVVQSNTNLDVRSIHPYLILAQRYHYQVSIRLPEYDLLYFSNDWTREQQIQHLIRARSSGDKIVPSNVLYRMVETFDQFRSRVQRVVYISDPLEIMRIL
jgi:predicted kinase